jgi:4-alpha-glucanotransferase
VLQFMVDQADFDAASIDEDCVCYTGTHDNDTTVGWFAGSQGRLADAALHAFQNQVAANVEGARESVHKAMISLCFKTRARLAIAPMQDYLGLDSSARLNTPGTAGGNWRWRVDEAGLARHDLGFIADGVNETGRS